jgi:alkylation response protein AidB-like acyl-CoA dehydrogenase
MDFKFTEDQNLLRNSIAEIMTKDITIDYVRECDEKGEYPYRFYERAVELGWIGLPFPEEYGGFGGNAIELVILGEEISRWGYDLAIAIGLSMFNGLSILHHGTEEQKQYYIRKVINGEIRVSISVTEPNAGSDAASLTTEGVKRGDVYIINGQKVFCSAAHAKNCIIKLYVRTDATLKKHQGITAFLIPADTKGLTIQRIKTLGRCILGTNELFLEDVEVSEKNILGGLNKGWDVMMDGLELERLYGASAYVGNTQTVLDTALQHAKERIQFGRPIGTFQAIAHMLSDMQTELEAGRLLVYRAAWNISQGKPSLKEVSMAKLYTSEMFARHAAAGMQIMGGYGYCMEYDMQRYFRDSRITTIVAGTSQIQRTIIARAMGLKVQ